MNEATETAKAKDESMEIMEATEPLRMCTSCHTALGDPVRSDAEKQTFKCPRCRREFTQYFGF